MKIIRNEKEIIGKDGRILILPDDKYLAACVCKDSSYEEATYAVFVDKIDGKYYLANEELQDVDEIDSIIVKYLSGNLDVKEVSADDLEINSFQNEDNVDFVIDDTKIIQDEEEITNNVETPNVFAVFDMSEKDKLKLNVFTYENVGDLTLEFDGEPKNDFMFFQRVVPCRIINNEVLYYPSLEYFLKLVSSLQSPIEIEVYASLPKPPYTSKKFRVSLNYILLNYRKQYVSSYSNNTSYSNFLADDAVVFDNGYIRKYNTTKSKFINLNERVNFVPNMSVEDFFYKGEIKRRF